MHVWSIALAASPEREAALRRLLAPDECRRAERFRFPEHRRRFTAARGALRTILGSYLGIGGADVRFRYAEQGKPSLAGAGEIDLRFNLSHSEDQALLAVATGAEVGVDVERLSARVAGDAIARRFFHPDECAALERAAPAERTAHFFRLWTLKEAYVKARGGGLSIPLSEFAFVAPQDAGPALLGVAEPAAERERWSAFCLPAEPGYTAALVVEGHGWSVQQREWPV